MNSVATDNSRPGPGDEGPPEVLIIGYGNPLRGDDGLGWVAAEALQRLLPASLAQVFVAHQLTPEMSEPISRCRLVLFIDASVELPAGQLDCQFIAASVCAQVQTLGHHASCAGLLALALHLYGRVPQAMLLAVGGESFDLGEELSGRVRSTLDRLLDLVPTLVRHWHDLRQSGTEEPSLASFVTKKHPPRGNTKGAA